jgi:hypothetical protein
MSYNFPTAAAADLCELSLKPSSSSSLLAALCSSSFQANIVKTAPSIIEDASQSAIRSPPEDALLSEGVLLSEDALLSEGVLLASE